MSRSPSHPEKILVVGPSWVGDMVMAQALFALLVERSQSGGACQIDVVAPPWSSPVALRMPQVTHVHDLAVPHGSIGLGARWTVAKEVRRREYDRAIILPRTFKSALLPLWAGISVRTGYRGEHRYGLINDMREFDGKLLRSTAERYCALGVSRGDSLPPPVPPPALTVDEPNRQRLIAELNLPTDVPVVALCPGAAFGSSKRWPVARFGSIAKEMVRRGFAVWVIGSPGEAPLGAAITEHEPSALDLCGKSTLIDAVDLLSMADVTVTNDSGLLHIAAAVGSHVVALYGSTPPWFAPPLTSRHSVHYAGLECSPCFKRECPLGHHNCMGFIAPDVIANEVVEVLEARL